MQQQVPRQFLIAFNEDKSVKECVDVTGQSVPIPEGSLHVVEMRAALHLSTLCESYDNIRMRDTTEILSLRAEIARLKSLLGQS